MEICLGAVTKDLSEEVAVESTLGSKELPTWSRPCLSLSVQPVFPWADDFEVQLRQRLFEKGSRVLALQASSAPAFWALSVSSPLCLQGTAIKTGACSSRVCWEQTRQHTEKPRVTFCKNQEGEENPGLRRRERGGGEAGRKQSPKAVFLFHVHTLVKMI